MNRNFPHFISFDPQEYMGMGAPHLALVQGLQQIKYSMGHMCVGNHTSTLLQILKDQEQILSVPERCSLRHPQECILPWIPTNWIT